ncbi:hypothetical protein [Agrobacterium sp. P15N1-A]|uniref:hypothetical protein n=1 Tax=Agrobacterium sp. P15N1-A TaxID=3342820 RepID=UPI0037D1DF65
MRTTRRTFLGGAAVASLPIAAVANAAIATPEETVHERLHRLMDEFKATVMEINPNVRFAEDSIRVELDESLPLPLMIVAQWAKGRYEGDGTYRGGNRYDTYSRYRVKKLDRQIGGQPTFSVIPVGERDRSKWMTLSQPRFESFIGEKLR